MAKDNSMSEQEFVAQCLLDFPDNFEAPNELLARDVLEACEVYYMNGCYDDLSGDSEAPTGHFYRIHRWIVTTNSQGFRFLDTFDNEDEASKAFKQRDDEYSEWSDQEGDYA